jgi:phage tail sheath protein FI
MNINSSYGFLDGNYKYQYDKYNDNYRWVPLAGDIAGLCVFTDSSKDAWWSPGGLNRGKIKGVVKLAFNPTTGHRDQMYKSPYGINPVVSMPGQGTVLWGDKTMLTKPSAFDRINVRRLFIVLEKAISTASKYMLFEFNDAFTRSQFKGMVEPFMKDVKGRRGMYDFLVVCDETNNTGEVLDRNEFVADIYIKPARSINFITLNFIATKSGVEFSELFGAV